MLVVSPQTLMPNTTESTKDSHDNPIGCLSIYQRSLRIETLQRKGMYEKSRAIYNARMVAEFRQIGHSAKKTPEDVDHWDRLVNRYQGLRCGRGYDKPLNEGGFRKRMIHGSSLFDEYPETKCMRQGRHCGSPSPMAARQRES